MSNLLEAVESYVNDLLTRELNPNFRYHNLAHTQRVVQGTKELLAHHDPGPADREALQLAAWLHDIGYTKGCEAHEERSCDMARAFLNSQGNAEKKTDRVCELILATRRFHQPRDLAEQILRDADAAHLASDQYPEFAEALRLELELMAVATYTDDSWREANLEMFQEEHQYNTAYALEHWQPGKEANLERLIKEGKKRKKIAKKEAMKAQYKAESPERGIQTMYRVSMRNHLKLSDIADTKANILLSVNAIIISMVIANLIPKLDNPSNDYLIVPTIIFIIFSIGSMILSVLATRPNITSGAFSKADVEERRVNLLFFGNFHKMSLQEYEWAMRELIKDKEYVYSTLTKDLYFLGLVLNRKYKLLRWTYTLFMIGMILSVIAFFVALKYYGPERIL